MGERPDLYMNMWERQIYEKIVTSYSVVSIQNHFVDQHPVCVTNEQLLLQKKGWGEPSLKYMTDKLICECILPEV